MLLYGTIGFEVIAAVFIRELGGLKGRNVTLHVNSLGGDVFEARAMANAVRAHGKVDVVIDGIAASAATVVALAGRTVKMAANAQFMIHDPRAVSIQNASSGDLESALQALGQVADDYAAAYVAKTGLADGRVRELMAAETWLTAAEALELGFIDEVIAERLPLAAMARGLHGDRFRYHNRPDFLKDAGMKTQLAAFLAQLLDKVATDEMPRAALLRAVAQAANADLSLIEAIAEGRATITPTAAHLDAFAKVLDADAEALRIEAGKDWQIWAKPRQKVDGAGGKVIDFEAATNEGTRRERDRVAGIERTFAAYPQHGAIRARAVAEGLSLEAAQSLLLDALGKETKPAQSGGPYGGVTEDGLDKLRAGITIALTARGDMNYAREHRHELTRNEFFGMSLVEMCRETLRREGRIYSGDARFVTGEALRVRAAGPGTPGMGTGNFPVILEDIANKFLHQGWTEADETWRAWCAVRPMNDFKAHSFFNLSEFDDLLEVKEREEYQEAQFKEAGEKATLVTYGRLFSISRHALINDDSDAFTTIPRAMGRAAARKVGDLPYAVLTLNANMADGAALFVAGHSNLATGVKPPTTANFDALRVLMARQTGPNGKTLNIRPRYVLTPVTLEGACRVVVAAESEVNTTDTAARASKIPNSVRGLVEVISDPRLDANSTVAWYFAADPAIVPTVIVGFLGGNEAPVLEQQDGWNIDGTHFKVRIDAVAKAIDWRGLAKNAGA
jgi:ATP-dependent protease ClpP protease subunit